MLCRERLLTEHMADVFFAIKTIRAQRPGMVENSVRIVHNDNYVNIICVLLCLGAVWVHSQDTNRNNGSFG